MRLKSFAMFAMSSLIAASLAYVAPAMAANETSNIGDMNDNSSMVADNSDNMTQNPNAGDSSGSVPGGGGNQNNNGDGTPDTATGDDDY